MKWNWVKFMKFYRAYDFYNARANTLLHGPIKKRVRRNACERKIIQCEWCERNEWMKDRKKTQMKLNIWKKQLHYSNDSRHNQLPRIEIHSHTHTIYDENILFFPLSNCAHCHNSLKRSRFLLNSNVKMNANCNSLLTDLCANHIVFRIHLNHFRRSNEIHFYRNHKTHPAWTDFTDYIHTNTDARSHIRTLRT